MAKSLANRRLYWATHPEYRAKEKSRQLTHRDKRIIRRREIYSQYPERYAFTGILQRCNNPRNQKWGIYGGRGIKCLFTSFEEFFKEVGKRPGHGYSIDRISNDGNYEPGNVRWATLSQQNKNRRISCHTSII